MLCTKFEKLFCQVCDLGRSYDALVVYDAAHFYLTLDLTLRPMLCEGHLTLLFFIRLQ